MTATKHTRDIADIVYQHLVEDEDARVCRDIPDQACDEQPRAFLLQTIAQTLTKASDSINSARLSLAWILSALAAPVFFIAMLVPVRESLSLVPQLFVAQAIRERAVRKYFYVTGALLQSLALALMIPVVMYTQGTAAGIGIIGLLILFSLARGICSVASKDVLGKTISKSRRGRLNGITASLAGVATLTVALVFLTGLLSTSEDSVAPFLVILGIGSLLWALAAVVYSQVPEVPGATSGGGNAISEALASLSILRTDPDFQRFVIARALLVSTAFAVPYLVTIIERANDSTVSGLGSLLLADGAAGFASGYIWGRLSDQQAHRMMSVAAALGVTTLVLALLIVNLAGSLLGYSLTGAGILFLACVAHQGSRVARKTYLVDLATSENRAQYTAVSNTVIGIFLLCGMALAAVDSLFGTQTVIGLLAIVGLIASVRCWTLKPVG